MAEMVQRPDPDALLAQLEADALQARRGKLKIFFGASPGVGKTYAMLSAARVLRWLASLWLWPALLLLTRRRPS